MSPNHSRAGLDQGHGTASKITVRFMVATSVIEGMDEGVSSWIYWQKRVETSSHEDSAASGA